MPENSSENQTPQPAKLDWRDTLDALGKVDRHLLARISRKMMNHLCWSGNDEANALLRVFGAARRCEDTDSFLDSNQPIARDQLPRFIELSDQAFRIAEGYMSDEEISELLHRWLREERSGFLINVLENLDLPLNEVGDALDKYEGMSPDEVQLSVSAEKGFRVSLIRRFLTDQLQFVNVAKEYLNIHDFHELCKRMIFPPGSHGKLGGKSAGLLLASQVLKHSRQHANLLGDIKIPKTWYVTSDGLRRFVYRNNIEEVFNQKYKEIDQVRQEYPHIVQVFKSSEFSAEIVQGLHHALEDFGDHPLIVRSSSLLEDRMGTSFAGKYKSLFLANRGTMQERLAALMDAIAEVYASTFSPDPIEYRSERGLIDFNEEMGVMIQQVVGTTVGKYFLPSFAGVAFSHNEFRWSPRIKREDGLVRIVPGLGTRAVDRLGDDYPVLVAPGQPGLRANVSIDEMLRYTPQRMDVIDLEAGRFRTMRIDHLLKEVGYRLPELDKVASLFQDGHLRAPMGGQLDEDDDVVITFDGLLSRTSFVQKMHCLLTLLSEKLGTPVDVEFACDGKDLYLLQCRPQSQSRLSAPAPIPHNLPKDDIVFSANRFVSNGQVPDITHIVYVDPEQYGQMKDLASYADVGRAVSRLNKTLPKRQFILMGPGRWGSRGDVKLGVQVTYSDINNTSVLIEVARQKGSYVPDLSFGTHFFQDLVEASIRYLPLYPDDEGVYFNEQFLAGSHNTLPDILPGFAHLQDVVRVIDVQRETDGRILRIAFNADQDEAMAYLGEPGHSVETSFAITPLSQPAHSPTDHWQWRMSMATSIAANIDPHRLGVKAAYVLGSTKNATAGPASDIDMLFHVEGDSHKQELLQQWLEGWSLCLDEMNFLRTGHRSTKLLDAHFVTDQDIANKTSYAIKINAVTDPARRLELGSPTGS